MILEATDVSIQLSGKMIVNNASLSTEYGSITGIIGPNGCGKSTFLRGFTRVIRPNQGKIKLDGIDIWEDFHAKEFARNVAVLGQEHNHELAISVEEVVASGRTPYLGALSIRSKVDNTVIYRCLDDVGMLTAISRRFNQLSGGEKQRVLLARALAQEPKLLVLDEPTNHLDAKAQFELLDLVKNLGISVLMVIHDLTLASRYCDYLYIMQNGTIRTKGLPKEVLNEENIRNVFNVRSAWFKVPELGVATIALAPNRPNRPNQTH